MVGLQSSEGSVVDENGNVNYTDDITRVPQNARADAQQKNAKKTGPDAAQKPANPDAGPQGLDEKEPV